MIVDGTIIKCKTDKYKSAKSGNIVDYSEFVLKDNTSGIEYNVMLYYPKISLNLGDIIHCSISVNTGKEGYIVDKNANGHVIEITGKNTKIATSTKILDSKTLELEKKVKKLSKLNDDDFEKLVVKTRNDNKGQLDTEATLMYLLKQYEDNSGVEVQKLLQERNLLDLNETEALQLLDIEKRCGNPNPARIGHIENYVMHLREMSMFEKLIDKLDKFISGK